MPKPTRIYSIDSIEFALTKSMPPSLIVMATGRATSTGWSDIKLEPLEKTLSPDGILDLAFVGVPPQEVFVPYLVPVTAHYVWKDAEGVIGVKIHARSNDMTRLILETRGPFTTERVGEEGPPITEIAGEGHGATERFAKTMAVGEEGPPWTTWVYGEETPHKTFIAGEEHPPTLASPVAENMTFTHGEHPASIPQLEEPWSTVGAELGPWRDPLGPIETGGISAFGRR